jgi:hypothetical protein
MFAGNLEPVALAVLSDGERGLTQLALFRPVRPTLAQPGASRKRCNATTQPRLRRRSTVRASKFIAPVTASLCIHGTGTT